MVWDFTMVMPTIRWAHLQKLLRDLEKSPVHSSRAFFDGCGTTPLYETMLQGKEVCMLSLPEPTGDLIIRNSLPPTFYVQT